MASRLSEAGQESDLIELDDGDLIVLGAAAQVDGGTPEPTAVHDNAAGPAKLAACMLTA